MRTAVSGRRTLTLDMWGFNGGNCSVSLTHTLVRCEFLTVGTVNFIGLRDRILGLQEVGAHSLLYSRHMKVARSALHTGRLYARGGHNWYSFLLEAESIPGP